MSDNQLGRRRNTRRSAARSNQRARQLRTLAVRLTYADGDDPIVNHVVEWFDGKEKVGVTQTDATGRVLIPLGARSVAKLRARVLRPHPDPVLPPVLLGITAAVLERRG